MSSVTNRISAVTQPRGGFINPSEFDVVNLNDGKILNSYENVHGSYIGLTVDYLTRYCLTKNAIEAFKISIYGACRAELLGGVSGAEDNARDLVFEICGLDDDSIINACKLTAYDVWYRSLLTARTANTCDDINPDEATIHNIRVLTERSIAFWENNGPIIKDGFDFKPVTEDENKYKEMIKNKKGTYGGYTSVVNTGDGDFLTKDTLWDFKVLRSEPTSKHTLQLLMYWIMGKHSGQEIYKTISKIGIYNPRLNKIYTLDMNKVPENIIKTVEKEVICYS